MENAPFKDCSAVFGKVFVLNDSTEIETCERWRLKLSFKLGENGLLTIFI